MEETWKPVPGYEEWYEVSNLGRVRSHYSKEPKVIVQYMSSNGYMQVSLCKEHIHKTTAVHRIVAAAFLPKDPEKTQVDHVNGVKTDNRACNLEWVTPKENTIRSVVIGLKPVGEKHRMSKLKEHDIMDIRYLYNQGAYSQKALGTMFGVSKSVIGMIVHNKSWRHVKGVAQ